MKSQAAKAAAFTALAHATSHLINIDPARLTPEDAARLAHVARCIDEADQHLLLVGPVIVPPQAAPERGKAAQTSTPTDPAWPHSCSPESRRDPRCPVFHPPLPELDPTLSYAAPDDHCPMANDPACPDYPNAHPPCVPRLPDCMPL